MNPIMRNRIRLTLAVVPLGMAGLVAFSQSKEKPNIDPEAYEDFMKTEVTDIYDLEGYFSEQQSFFLPMMPPAADLTLNQPGFPTVIPFNWKMFPDEFNKQLSFEYENSVPVYPVTIIEDPTTRETTFLNAEKQVIFSLSPSYTYDPFVYLRSIFPALYAGRYTSTQISKWQSLYDPARIRISARLVPTEYVEPYLYVSALLFEQAMSSLSEEDGGGGGMYLMSGEQDSNIVFLAIYRVSTGNHMVIGYPEDFTNRLDVFTSTELLDEWWTFAAKGLSTAGTNQIAWVDTNYWAFIGLPYRNYSAGNADLDSDGDGYADAAEMMVYKSDPTNSLSHPVKVSGSVNYSGFETGTIYAIAAWSTGSWSIVNAISMPSPGPWTNDVCNNHSYWFRAFRDVNASFTRDSWEPWGEYGSGSTLITGETTGINITIGDQPSIWGSLSYTGNVNGAIHVIAVNDATSWSPMYGNSIPWMQEGTTGEIYLTEFPVAYGITDLPSTNYWIRAFVDANSNGTRDVSELIGQYGVQTIAVSNRRIGINFSLQSPPSVSGAVSYTTFSGGQTGLIYVVAAASSNSCATNYSAVLSAPGPYQIAGIPPGSYWLWAWRDSDGNKTCGVYEVEARGYYTNDTVLITGQLVNIDITMTDPDSDSDGLGDWWEESYFPDLFSSGTNDNDGDKLFNLYEYYAGTDPTAGFVDTDGDGMSDDWEIWYELNPNDPSDAHTDFDGDGWTNLEEYEAGKFPDDEFSYPPGSWYVATNGMDSAGRGGYTNPLMSISYAISSAASGNRIILMPGTYSGATNRNIGFGEKSLTITGIKGYRDETVIDGQQLGRIFFITNAYSSVTIRDLNIRNGYINHISGGGVIYSSHSTVEIIDCKFTGNYGYRGGVVASTSNATLRVKRCRFEGNSAQDGGAIWANNGTWLYVDNSLFVTNSANGSAGAISYSQSGGAFLLLAYNTFLDNRAQSSGGAVNRSGSGTTIINNCIFWGNTPDQWTGSLSVQYSCVQGTSIPAGAGNITNNPVFAEDGWRLTPDSPCRNTGTNYMNFGISTDLEGDHRIEEWHADMGADEYTNFTTRLMHMPSYDQSNKWGITFVGATTKVWAAALGLRSGQSPLYCRFNFGDGQESSFISVGNEAEARYIGTTHIYSTAAVYDVSVSFWENMGIVYTQNFQIACRETNDFDAKVYRSIEDGLIWLYNHATYIGNGCYWRYTDGLNMAGYVAHPIGMAIKAFADFGHHASLTNVIYSSLIEQGLNYVVLNCLESISILTNQCHYDPDANTNGLGITIAGSSESLYEIGAAMYAIVSAGNSNAIASSFAPVNIKYRSYLNIIQDMADYCGWAQTCSGNGRGGWRYRPLDLARTGSDNSASFWPVLGLSAAKRWNITIPNTLYSELTNWVAYSQNSYSGFFGYTGPDTHTSARTLSGLAQLAFLGREVTNTAVKSARQWLEEDGIGLPGTNDHYAMHILAEGATMFDPPLELLGRKVWRFYCVTNLLRSQKSDGSWMGYYNDTSSKAIGSVFGTAASVSILAATIPMRIVVSEWTRVPSGSPIYSDQEVMFHAKTLLWPDVTNITLTTWYRTASTNSFIAIGMTNYITSYTATSSIPAQTSFTKVEYYLEAIYSRDGVTTTQRFPSAHVNDYTSYTIY